MNGSLSAGTRQHPEVAPAAHVGLVVDLHDRAWGGPCRVTDGVREGLQIVHSRHRVLGIDIEPHDLPTARRRQPVGVDFTEVVGMRLGVRRQRPDDRGRV
jgi:hypothetical protein